MRPIGFAGRGGVGKSTTAAAVTDLERRAVNIPISTPLKEMLAELYREFGEDESTIARKIGGDLKREPCSILGWKTPTHAMQTLGTEWGRQLIDPDLWARWWSIQAAQALEDGQIPMNDSVRFENEAAEVRAFGGVVIRLEGQADLDSGHASERQIEADAVVTVDASPSVIARRVIDIAS